MSLLTTPDITILVSVSSTSTSTSTSAPTLATERRISPSWQITTLKSKLETVTGIPPSSQLLRLLTPSGSIFLSDQHGEAVSDYPFRDRSELEIGDSRPVGMRGEFSDVSKVEKFEMPITEYEKLDDSVLAWKRRRGLGRFDPTSRSRAELEAERRVRDGKVVEERGIIVGSRCRIGADDGRRGVVRWVGEVKGLGGEKEVGCFWVGVELDEPGGRNDGAVLVSVSETGTDQDRDNENEAEGTSDGRVAGKQQAKAKTQPLRLFQCAPNYGVFARPEKIEMGDWPVLDDLGFDSDMEEI